VGVLFMGATFQLIINYLPFYSDKERHEKVKRIYQEASMQQGELNELARAKKKKKF